MSARIQKHFFPLLPVGETRTSNPQNLKDDHQLWFAQFPPKLQPPGLISVAKNFSVQQNKQKLEPMF